MLPDESGLDFVLPSSLPDGEFRGVARMTAPYNIALPLHFFKVSFLSLATCLQRDIRD